MMDTKLEIDNKPKYKLGLFMDSFFPMIDGVTMVLDNYARRLSKFFDVTVFVPTGREKYDDSVFPYKVVRSKFKLPLVFVDYDCPLPNLDVNFVKQLEGANLDIVHIHSPFAFGKIGLKYAKKHNIPCVATMHTQFKQDFFKATNSKVLTNMLLKNIVDVFNECTECWAVNEATGNVFLDYGVKNKPNVQLNGTESVPYTNLEKVQELRAQLNIQSDQKVFLFVGRLINLKNIFFIADCLKRLKDNNFKFKMIYVGTGIDEKQLKEYVSELGLDDDVIFTGNISDRDVVARYYALSDLFLFPSLYDANSIVQIEAACQKVPTLFIEGSVTSSTVQDGFNGYKTGNSVEEYSNKIIEIFNDQENYEKICQNAFDTVYMPWDKVISKVVKDYLRLIEKNIKGN